MKRQTVSVLEQTLRDFDSGGRAGPRLGHAVQLAQMLGGLLIAAKRLADKHGTGLTFHQSFRQTDVDASLRDRGKRPLAWLEEVGVLGSNVLLAHVLAVDDAEIEVLARTETKVVTCPLTSLRIGGGLTVLGKLPEMLAQGVCVALGTDDADFGPVDITRAMYLVATLYKDARHDPREISAEAALEMATIKGAEALGLDHEIGSIEIGKKADLVLLDTGRPEWRALFNPVNALVYTADGRSVHTAIVDGRVVVEIRRPTFIDEWGLILTVQDLGERLLRRTGTTFPSRWPVV
jgi:5-methylthioadenosine/S-adenosylhomocysteine deaminase